MGLLATDSVPRPYKTSKTKKRPFTNLPSSFLIPKRQCVPILERRRKQRLRDQERDEEAMIEKREEEKEKRVLELNWSTIYRHAEEDAPPQLVVIGGTNESYTSTSDLDNYGRMSIQDLTAKIGRIRTQIDTLSVKLPDNGAKLRKQLQNFQDEHDRRTKLGYQKKAEELQNSTRSQNSYSPGGAYNGAVSEAPSSQGCSQSSFVARFSEKLEEKPDCTTSMAPSAYSSELKSMGRGSHQNTGANGPVKKRKRGSKTLRQFIRCSKHSRDEKCRASVGAEKVISLSNFYQPLCDDNSSSRFSQSKSAFPKSMVSEVRTSHDLRTRKNRTVVLVDEEDCELIRTSQQEDDSIERMEATIYYPSRDDPKSVELCSSDIKYLDPEAFLSSTIMNFYIRYLQQPDSVTGGSQLHYHFFNTYFYEKLKEAVSYKGNDTDAFFLKFRRWWKGVNIFQKAYIFLPIHETQHWSLVIICIPDKADESGPVILHLDSLGMHISSHIFENVRRFLKLEWSYLKQAAIPPNFPIAENVWKRLYRKTEEKIITVPQQKNDYDCGIFVLYFIERFIQEAPNRIQKKHLAMFSRQWFKPEDAYDLRKRIRMLVAEEFKKSSLGNANRTEDERRESSLISSSEDEDPTPRTQRR